MMKVIYKYPLEITDTQAVNMPHGAQLLSVQKQNGELCLWALVDTAQPTAPRQIVIVGTGNPIQNPGTYVDSVQMENEWGVLVWHIFDRGLIPIGG